MNERITQAVFGAISGATIGAPFCGQKQFAKMVFYEPIPSRMTNCLDLDAWVIYASNLQFGHVPSCVPELLVKHQTQFELESAFAYSHAKRGLGAPASGSFSNPLAEGAGAIGRTAFWGLIFEGNPKMAHSWAACDAGFDHSRDGVWIPAAIAATIASIENGTQFSEIIKCIASFLPPESLGHKAISSVLQCAGLPGSVSMAVDRVTTELSLHDSQHSVIALTVILASLATAPDPETALCSAAGCGRSAIGTCIATGIIATLSKRELQPDWIVPLGEMFIAGNGFRNIDPPESINDFTTMISECRARVCLPPPIEVETAEEPPPFPALALRQLSNDYVLFESDWLKVRFEFLDSPCATTGKPWRAVVHFENSSPLPTTVEASIVAPEGWEVATKLSSFRLDGSGSASYPIVLQTSRLIEDATLSLQFNETVVQIPIFAPVVWHSAGPFDDPAQEAFHKQFPPERRQDLGETFSGRSGLKVVWEPLLMKSNSIDVEPLFKSGPGVVILYSRIVFPKQGSYSVIAAGSPGVIVRIDGQEVVKYADTHKPVARNIRPYVGEFDTIGEAEVVIKLTRILVPAEPLTLYFLDDRGQIVVPKSAPLPQS